MMQTLRTQAVAEIEIEIDVEPDLDDEIQAVLDDLTEWVEDVRSTDRYRCVGVGRPR